MKKILTLLGAIATLCSCIGTTSSGFGMFRSALMPTFNPAIEIISEYEYITYQRNLNIQNDAEFFSLSEMPILQIDTSRVLNSTFSTSAEIPFCSNVSEITRIFRDGSMTYEKNINLDPDNNPLLFLHESPVDLSTIVSRITISSGVLTTYNSEGDILYQQSVDIPDYSDVVRDLSSEVASYNQPSNFHTPGNTVRDINWLRNKLITSSVDSSSEFSDSTRVYEFNGTVVVEQNVNLPSEDRLLKYKTFYSTDITESFGSYKLVDNELKFCSRNIYDDSSSNQTTIINILGKRPVRTISKEKVIGRNGFQLMKIEERNYSINTINLNL